MKRYLAILLLVLTLLPWVYMIYFFSTFGDFSETEAEFDARFQLHLYTIFYVWGLTAVYVVSLFKSKTVPQEKKALWAVVLFMGNIMAMPVYWYYYMWQAHEDS